MTVNARLKSFVVRALPPGVLRILRHVVQRKTNVAEVFSTIYREGAWGTGSSAFYSGTGSHDPALVAPYVDAVRRHLLTCPGLRLVDIGCGDFNVGRQLVDSTGSYLACDVVPELIERNRQEFRMPNLRFEVVNAITDRLPTGDIVCLRQVLQHLNNAQVSGITRKLRQYQQWIVTEALPGSSRFAPNVDKPTDERTRLGLNSGVVLTAPPFNVRPLSEKVICEVPEYGGVVRTVLYQF